MLRGRACGFFRVLPLVNPPGVPQSVFHAAIGHELPDASRARSREGQRLERTFRLRQINQVLRNAFLMQDSPDHFAIAPGTPQPRLDNGSASWGLEKIEEGEYFVVYCE